MEPLAYGYMRVTEDFEDDQIWQMELGLHKLAEAEGFRFVSTFHDDQPGYHGAFNELIEELTRAQARHIVVPSLDHLSAHPLLREIMLMRLGRVGARVWLVEQ
jgi:DNA invertase Pin-like site-specific DNA recombinase